MDKVEKEGNFAKKKENNHSISNEFNININLPNEQNRKGQANSGESTDILYEAIDISASGPQTEEHKKHREEVMHYFTNRANTQRTYGLPMILFSRQRRTDRKVTKNYPTEKAKREREREKERRRLKD